MASRRNNSSGAWSGSLLNLVNAGGGSGRSLAADRRTAESDAASDLDLDLELPPPPPITVMDRVDATTAAEVTYRMRQALRRRSLGSRRQLTFSAGLVASGSQMDADARARALERHRSHDEMTISKEAAAAQRRWETLKAYSRQPSSAGLLDKGQDGGAPPPGSKATDGAQPSSSPTRGGGAATAGAANTARPPAPLYIPADRRSDESDDRSPAHAYDGHVGYHEADTPAHEGHDRKGGWRAQFGEPSCIAPRTGRAHRGGHFGFGLGLWRGVGADHHSHHHERRSGQEEEAAAAAADLPDDIDPAERARILEKIMGGTAQRYYYAGIGGERPSRWVMDPLSQHRMLWDLVMCLAILYSAVEIPFSTAFLWSPPLYLRVLDIFIDSLLLCDVVVCFFTGYVDKDDKKTMNQWRVAKHYFFGWFVFDLISALPYDAIAKSFLAPEERIVAYQNQAFRIVNVLKLIRLVRLQKLVRYLFRWNDDLGLASAHSLATQTACIVFFIVLFVHTVGCIEFVVPMLSQPAFPHDSWPRMLAEQNITQSCAILIDAFVDSAANLTVVNADGTTTTLPRPFDPEVDPFDPSRSPLGEARWECYTHAFFQSLSQMLCIGFGLVNPRRPEELWVTIFSMGLGAAMYAMSLSFVVNVISTVDYPSRNYKEKLEELNEYMRVRCLPPALRTRLRNYFFTLYPNRRIFDEPSVLGRFSHSLTQEVNIARCETLFGAMPLFSDKDANGNDAEPALLSAIGGMLSPETAAPGDWLTEQGHICRRVCFIEQGVVEVVVDGNVLAEMGDGTYIGEISALGAVLGMGSEAGFATATVKALEHCLLHIIGHDDFRRLVDTFPAAFGLPMRNIAKLRLDRGRPEERLGGSIDERGSRANAPSSSSSSDARPGGGEESTSLKRRSTAYVANAMTDDDVKEFMTQQREQQKALEEASLAASSTSSEVTDDSCSRQASARRFLPRTGSSLGELRKSRGSSFRWKSSSKLPVGDDPRAVRLAQLQKTSSSEVESPAPAAPRRPTVKFSDATDNV